MFCDKNLINGNNLRTYRKIKESYNLEKYLLLDLDENVIRFDFHFEADLTWG
jgi:hypothetical protein